MSTQDFLDLFYPLHQPKPQNGCFYYSGSFQSQLQPAEHHIRLHVVTDSRSALYGMKCLRSLEHWDRGFEFHSKAWMSVRVFSVFVLGSGLATG
jgi:hypothetical protein